MKIILCVTAALTAYLVSAWNPAITLSRAIYKTDIRNCGSKNPGFTNFKRCFGNKWAWCVFILDISKAALTVAFFAHLFDTYFDAWQLGAAYTGRFTLLGHAFPLWYSFRGGKGFLVCLSTFWVVSPIAGLSSTLIMVVLLLITKYMSLSTVVALLLAPFIMLALDVPSAVCAVCFIDALFVTVRHRENFKRLINGNESKFSMSSRKD